MKRKFFFVSIFSAISIAACSQKDSANYNEPCVIQSENTAIASRLLTLSDAEKVIGEPAKLTCNSMVQKGDTTEYKCEYTALATDTITGKTGKLFFMYEIYKDTAAATNAYAGIYDANRRHEGIEVIPRLGNNAYFHTDHTGFYFLLARKNEKMIRLKLNKITSHSSEANFKVVTTQIVDKL